MNRKIICLFSLTAVIISSCGPDSAEWRAEKFLKDGMRYHLSYPRDVYEAYCAAVDSVQSAFPYGEKRTSALKSVAGEYRRALTPAPDSREISKEELRACAASAVRDWKELPSLKGVTFKDFCEYYLPYKVAEGQAATAWRSSASLAEDPEYRKLLRKENFLDNPRMHFLCIHNYLTEHSELEGDGIRLPVPPIDPEALLTYHGADCFERCWLELMYCRANGIAAAMDYSPSWVYKGGIHSWLSVFMKTRLDEPFEAITEDAEPGYFKGHGWRMPKVYRTGWSPRKILVRALKSGISLPAGLSQLFVKDVTDRYCRTCGISVPVSLFSGYAFLSVFDGNEWVPVDISWSFCFLTGFKKVSTGITYCITSAKDGRQISRPFYLNREGRKEYFETRTGNTVSVRIRRKHPTGTNVYDIRELLEGAGIYGSVDDGYYFPVARLADDCLLAESVPVRDTSGIRYLKILPSNGRSVDLAELYFYDISGQELIATDIFPPLNDGNPYTRARISIGRHDKVDFGRKVNLGHISCIKRGDGNDIIPGREYELYLNNGRRWVFLERKRATDIEIVFGNVPAGALLWIRDASEGRENALLKAGDTDGALPEFI